jgi:hypothetical protein
MQQVSVRLHDYLAAGSTEGSRDYPGPVMRATTFLTGLDMQMALWLSSPPGLLDLNVVQGLPCSPKLYGHGCTELSTRMCLMSGLQCCHSQAVCCLCPPGRLQLDPGWIPAGVGCVGTAWELSAGYVHGRPDPSISHDRLDRDCGGGN